MFLLGVCGAFQNILLQYVRSLHQIQTKTNKKSRTADRRKELVCKLL